jgi:hypothetical protein
LISLTRKKFARKVEDSYPFFALRVSGLGGLAPGEAKDISSGDPGATREEAEARCHDSDVTPGGRGQGVGSPLHIARPLHVALQHIAHTQ